MVPWKCRLTGDKVPFFPTDNCGCCCCWNVNIWVHKFIRKWPQQTSTHLSYLWRFWLTTSVWLFLCFFMDYSCCGYCTCCTWIKIGLGLLLIVVVFVELRFVTEVFYNQYFRPVIGSVLGKAELAVWIFEK